MGITSTHHRPAIGPRWVAVVAVAVTAVVVAAWLATSSATAPPAPAGTGSSPSATELDRGAGDPCALRLEAGGGFIEGLGRANRCGEPGGEIRRGGRLP